jgi:quercetin dioxygenase-like cupin family protein
VSYSVLPAGEAPWRPSRLQGALNVDLAGALGATTLGARLWRLRPGQSLPLHRHATTHELYIVVDGEGGIRVGEASFVLPRLSAVLVSPEEWRQIFNDSEADALWLITGAPAEGTAEYPE